MTDATDARGDEPIDGLNEPQREAVAHAHGPMIVFAGAGSGKTRVITYRIANLVATHDVPPYRILAVTFTNKAAGEMRERLVTLLGEEITRELWIGTFHAVCVRLIRRYSEAIGISKRFTIYDDSDQKSLMKRVMKELAIDEKRISPQQVLGRIGKEKQEGRGPDEFEPNDWLDEIVHRCFVAYQDHLTQSNAVDFSDLLLIVMRFAERKNDDSAEHLRRRFSHILVDEFQDTNLVQYRLVRALAGDDPNICVVGDDDQSIYRWRGADIRNIRNFTRDYRGARLVKLEQNYRSTENVVGAALGVIRTARDRQPKELWTANDAGAPVKIVHCANERDEADYVVKGLRRLIREGISPREIAVFYRVHAQSRVLEDAMRKHNVPYQIVGGTRFFDRAEIKDVLAYLRVVANPQSDVDLLRIINKPPRKIGNKTVSELAATARKQHTPLFDALAATSERLPKAAKRALTAFHELMERAHAASTTISVYELASDLVVASGYIDWLQKQDNVESDSRVDNIQELLGAIKEYEEEASQANEPPSLEDYLTRVTLVSDADTMEDVPRVPMMTIHAAKGLEFDAVFVTGLEEGLFPLRGQEPGQEAELEEERRLAYVAITRARDRLELTHTNTRMIYGQTRYNTASRFLADIPPRHQERAATEALHQLSSGFTRGQMPQWRDIIRADSNGNAPRMTVPTRPDRYPRPEPQKRGQGQLDFETPKPPKPQYEEGERYVERDEHSDDFDDDMLDGRSVRVGMRVRHQSFGIGEIRDIGTGPDPAATVKFERGPKRVKLRFLRPA